MAARKTQAAKTTEAATSNDAQNSSDEKQNSPATSSEKAENDQAEITASNEDQEQQTLAEQSKPPSDNQQSKSDAKLDLRDVAPVQSFTLVTALLMNGKLFETGEAIELNKDEHEELFACKAIEQKWRE